MSSKNIFGFKLLPENMEPENTSANKKAPIWIFFTTSEQAKSRAVCTLCGGNYSLGSDKAKFQTTTNLKNHLKSKHHTEFTKFLKIVEDEKERKEKRSREDDCADTIPNSVANKKQKIELFQQTLPKYVDSVKIWDIKSAKAQEFHKDVFEFLVEDMQPWSMVQDRGFVRMYKKRFPNFDLATPRYYSTLLEPAYTSIKLKLKKAIKDDNPEVIATSLDAWSQFHNGYLGINCHYIDSDWKRKVYNLACPLFNETHTGEHIRNKHKSVLESFEIESKVTVSLRDNASNMVSCFAKGNIKGFGCLTHTIQLVIKDEIFGMKSVKDLLKKCRDLCSFANRSTNFYTVLKNQQWLQLGLDEDKFLSLPHSDTDTRWNSSYYMIKRILKIKAALISTLASDTINIGIEFVAREWLLMEQIENVLSIFESATRLLQYKDASISGYIPVITTIIRNLEKESKGDVGILTMKRGLLENMKRRFCDVESHEELVLATYLDPKYKCCFFLDPNTKETAEDLMVEKIKARLDTESNDLNHNISDPAIDTSEEQFENSFEKEMKSVIHSQSQYNDNPERMDMSENIRESLQRYLNSETLSLRKSALNYWKTTVAKTEKIWVKEMGNLAKIFLTPPPTSCDVERLFSTASHILNKKRNRLLPNNAERLLFVHENIAIVNYQY